MLFISSTCLVGDTTFLSQERSCFVFAALVHYQLKHLFTTKAIDISARLETLY